MNWPSLKIGVSNEFDGAAVLLLGHRRKRARSRRGVGALGGSFRKWQITKIGVSYEFAGVMISNARSASETGPVRCRAATAALEKVTMFGDRGI